MTTYQLTELLKRHIQRIDAAIAKRQHWSKIYSRIRLGYFAMAVISSVYYSGILSGGWFVLSLVVWGVGFLVILHYHRKVYQSQEKFELLRQIKAEHIARIQLDWDNIGYNEPDVELKDHPFAWDFNILGKHSLFHLLDTSIYPGGGRRLQEWLTNTSPCENTIQQRQKLVQELQPLMGFRDTLRVIHKVSTKRVLEKDWTHNEMLAWLRRPPKQDILRSLLMLATLSGLNFLLVVFAVLFGWTYWFVLAGVTAYLILYKYHDDKVVGLFDSAYNMEKILNRFQAALLHVERFKFTGKPELTALLAPFQQGGRPSAYIKKMQSLMARASLQANQILWGIVNLAIPWDMYYAWRIEQMKKELEQKLSEWLKVFYELEALSSLANFAFLHPQYGWPKFINNSQLLFEAQNLGHPLIPDEKKVTNHFEVKTGKDLFLITGSNMAGKSTFLRTVGINLVLANAGAPVDASSFRTRVFRLFSSINISDSLDDGLSHFYAEVKRLRALLDELEREHKYPLFFFVDEIYKGTNNRERYAGSAAFLKKVAEKTGVGMVSSHDLELSELEEEIPRLSNWAFFRNH